MLTHTKGRIMYNPNTLAFAKVVKNSKLNTLRLIVTFDTCAKAITVRNAALVTGDLCSITDNAEYKQHAIDQALQRAAVQLSTNNIQLL